MVWRGGPRSSRSYRMDYYRQAKDEEGHKGHVRPHYRRLKHRTTTVRAHRRRSHHRMHRR